MQKYIILFLLITASFLFLSSCNKESSEIGFNIQPGSDIKDLTSTNLSVSAYTIPDFSIASNQRSLSPLGEFSDPVFGHSEASISFQIRTSTNNANLSELSDNFNHLKLNLRYFDHYGDTSGQKSIKVYRILKDIYRDSTYYSDFKYENHELELLTETDFFVSSDSIISVILPSELMEEFINPANISHFNENADFIKFFKGFYVTASNSLNPGNFIYLDLLSTQSNVQLFYDDTVSYTFNISSNSTIINQFNHDYTQASSEIQAAIEDTTIERDLVYIQSLGGLKTKILFPELSSLTDSSEIIGINKAQLIISVKEDLYGLDNYPPPSSLSLIAITESGGNEFLTDYKVNGEKFGGVYNSSTQEYVFNIPLHIQELLNGKTDNGLYLSPLNNRIFANRAILHGNGDDELSMRLELLYTKY